MSVYIKFWLAKAIVQMLPIIGIAVFFAIVFLLVVISDKWSKFKRRRGTTEQTK